MAKKTSKPGKKANKNTTQTSADETQQQSTDDKNAVKQAEKSAKDQQAKVDQKDQKKADLKKTDPKKVDQKKSTKPAKAAPKKDSIFKKITTYFRNVRLEVKRTTWPSRDEVLRMSLIVVGALIFFGVFIMVIDWLMTQLLTWYSGFAPTPDPAVLPTDTGATPDASALPDGSTAPTGETPATETTE